MSVNARLLHTVTTELNNDTLETRIYYYRNPFKPYKLLIKISYYYSYSTPNKYKIEIMKNFKWNKFLANNEITIEKYNITPDQIFLQLLEDSIKILF